MAQLAALSDALGELHRALIKIEAGDDPAYKNPYALLNALMQEPRFAWLREISQLMIQLEELEEAGNLDLKEARSRVERIIGPIAFPSDEFAKKFETAIQHSPAAADALQKVRSALETLSPAK